MRVIAAVMVVMPISALLGFTLGINSILGMIVSLCVNLYGLYLLYHGLTGALGANPATAKVVMYVLAAILVIFMIVGLGTRNRINRLMNNVDTGDLQEMMIDKE
jgi:DMSO/TMAO reductase YedYZ heme-binding membrane subunit